MIRAICSVLSFSFLILFASSDVQAQTVVLVPDASLATSIGPSTCTSLRLGETIQFSRAGSCGGDIIVSNDRGVTSLLTTSAASFNFTFEVPGEYVVFCNATDASAAVPALCIIVSDAVPTVGEWGVITLGLLLMIFMVVAFKVQSKKTTALS